MRARLAIVAVLCAITCGASAQGEEAATTTPPATPAPSTPTLSWLASRIHIHGFASEGGFISTSNEYIGESSRGSLKFFEAALNVSAELTDELRVGLQLVSRSVGTLSEEVPRLDWGFLDYRFADWFGMRAGVIKMPLGLYNESIAVDAARAAILLPQSLYPIRNRDALVSHTGFSVYGAVPLGPAGSLAYQGWFGTLSIPRSALTLQGAELESVDTKYVTGGQLFYQPPLEGLRVGGTYMRAVIDFHLTLASESVTQLVMAGIVPAGHDGSLRVSQDPTSFWVASAEYVRQDWLFAAEYGRFLTRQTTSLPQVLPTTEQDAERFYVMTTYRASQLFELGAYYSVVHADVEDRRGRGAAFARPFHAFQRDLAATVRLDVNDFWLWKLEGHFIDGTAELDTTRNAQPRRRWGLFLLRTTVTF
jgi:hypothetical protein